MHGVDEQFGGTWESLRCPARDGLSERRCSCRRNGSFRLDWRSNRSGGWRRFAVVIVTGVDRTASSLFGGTYQFIQVGSFIVLFRSDAQTSQVALLFLKQLLEALAATSVENRWEDGVIAFLTQQPVLLLQILRPLFELLQASRLAAGSRRRLRLRCRREVVGRLLYVTGTDRATTITVICELKNIKRTGR